MINPEPRPPCPCRGTRGMFFEEFPQVGHAGRIARRTDRRRRASWPSNLTGMATSLLIITTAGCTALTASRKLWDKAWAGSAAALLLSPGPTAAIPPSDAASNPAAARGANAANIGVRFHNPLFQQRMILSSEQRSCREAAFQVRPGPTSSPCLEMSVTCTPRRERSPPSTRRSNDLPSRWPWPSAARPWKARRQPRPLASRESSTAGRRAPSPLHPRGASGQEDDRRAIARS